MTHEERDSDRALTCVDCRRVLIWHPLAVSDVELNRRIHEHRVECAPHVTELVPRQPTGDEARR